MSADYADYADCRPFFRGPGALDYLRYLHYLRYLRIVPLLLVLVACAPARPVDTEGPTRAVVAFVAALEARDAGAIVALLEPTDWRGEIGPELRSYLAMLDELDLRDEQYAVVEGDADSALVRVTGMFAYRFADGGGAGERPVDLRVETVRVGDRWYLRGLELPQPGGS